MNRSLRFTAAQRAEIDAWENTPLGREEFEARVRAPWTDREREDFDELVRWFCTRYPTVEQRFRAIRRRVLQLRQRTPAPGSDDE
jgi:hypothetical protein